MIRRAIIVLILLALAAVIVAWWLWDRAQAAPSWYAPPDPASAQVVERAEKVEYRLAEEVQKIRDVEATWTVRIPQSSINAWLASRLPEWIAHEQEIEWPVELGVPQVNIDENGVTLAVDVQHDGRRAVVAARLVPSVQADDLRLVVDRVGVGRMMLPAEGLDTLIGKIAGLLPSDVDPSAVTDVVHVLVGEGETIPSTFELSDGRRVAIVAVRCTDGAIEFKNRTLVRK